VFSCTIVEAWSGDRQADQAPPVAGHEVDRLRRDLLGGERKVAFVLPILVVDDDHQPSGGKILDGLFDRC
jgi:hypothetical protein